MKITVSVIKADVGGIGGHTRPSDGLLGAVKKTVKDSADLLIDYYIGYCGDDVHIVMSHTRGVDNNEIHKMAWDAFMAGTKVAREEGLYGAGQDLLKDSFSGNVKGMGPGVAEMEFEERPNEAFTVFAADKTEPGAFNYPFYRMFVDALSNTGLIVNKSLARGVNINIMDVEKPGRYVVSTVTTKDGEPIVASSTDRLHNIAGTYVGKDDPICVVRTQKNFPATEEVGSVFNNPHYVAGNTRGSHNMPLMPVKLNSAATINFCIPIVQALVFSMHNGKFVGPFDGFSTPDWDYIREIATKKALAMRSQGFVHPATLVPSELEYAEGYKARMSVLEEKMKPLEGSSAGGEKKENYEDPD
jgi:fructose 1,6-bisphosphate aldolase/phosphatase